MKLEQIWRYPFKGFAGLQSEHIALRTRQILPGDRQFAITTGHPKTHAQLDTGWLAKRHFIQQANLPALARFRLDHNPDTRHITLYEQDREVIEAGAGEYGLICDWLYEKLPEAFVERPRLVQLGNGGYTDTAAPWISLGTTASLNHFAEKTNTVPDMRRFRLNLLIDAEIAFTEFSWAGHILHIGEAQLEIIEPVGRCSAINANQDTGGIDADFLSAMPDLFNHTDLGVFASVIHPGEIRNGDKVVLGNRL